MDAGAALGGVDAEAGLSVGAVGDFGATVGVDRDIRFPRGNDGDAARGKQGAEADAEGQGVELFRLALPGLIVEAAARVVAAVGGIEHDDESGCGSGRGLSGGQLQSRRQNRERPKMSDF